MFFTALMVTTIGAIPTSQAAPTVRIASLHNLDYAKTACNDIKLHPGADYSTPEARAQCASEIDDRALGRKLEMEVQNKMAIDPRCGGVTVVRGWHPQFDSGDGRYNTAYLNKERWDLLLDFRPGSITHAWTITHWDGNHMGASVDGVGTPEEIADAVCIAVSGRGARIR
jgi:hypothetical protein